MCQCQGGTRCLHSWRNPLWAFTTSSAVFWQTYWLDMRFSQCSRVCSPLISDSKQTKSPISPNSPLLLGIHTIMLPHIKVKAPEISSDFTSAWLHQWERAKWSRYKEPKKNTWIWTETFQDVNNEQLFHLYIQYIWTALDVKADGHCCFFRTAGLFVESWRSCCLQTLPQWDVKRTSGWREILPGRLWPASQTSARYRRSTFHPLH